MGDNHDDTVEKFYFSASIKNSTNNPIIANYNINRSMPILKNCQDWETSVVNFRIPSSSIPLFVFENAATPVVPPLPAIPDMSTGYWVGIQTDSTLAAPAYGIHFEPVINFPGQIFNSQLGISPESPYSNYIFDYQLFIQQINFALEDAWTSAAITTAVAPFIYYNSSTSLFTLFMDTRINAFNGTAPSYQDDDTVKIYMNTKLYNFFRFNAIWNNSDFYAFQDTGPDYIINFGNPLFTTFAPTPFNASTNPAVSYYTLTQPYETLGIWAAYDKIIFATSTLPITNEIQGDINTGSSNQQYPTLLTFNIPNDQKKDASDYNYQPEGGLKWISLLKQQALVFFDINIVVQGSDSGDIIPIYLMPGESISFKLCFRLKSKLIRKKDKNNVKR